MIKKYEKERSAQQSQLAALSSKIDDLQAKASSIQEQIEDLSEQRSATQQAIAQLDIRATKKSRAC